jgi:hypothetical protein
MPSQRGQHETGIRSLLVVLRLIDPADAARGIRKDRRRHGQAGKPWRARVDSLVLQSIEIRHFEFAIGEHRRLQTVLRMPRANLDRRIGTDRDDLDSTRVELRSKLFPSP